MSLSFNPGVPTGSQTIASTTIPIQTNFNSLNTAFNVPVGGVSGGGNFCSYSLQATTTNFTLQPVNPIGILYTTASPSGNPELAYINNVNSVGAGPYTGTQLTGGGITAAAWCSFSVSGSTVTLGSNYNVSSVTRSAKGVYVVNFTRNFSSSGATAYAALITPNMVSVTDFAIKIAQENKSVGSFQFSIQDQTNTFQDPVSCDCVFFGTLS